jgi:glycosyltransferase involved in cell wall biosynthesis
MSPQIATIVIVPRERFSFTQRSLESILTHTTGPSELLYIDGNSPLPVRDHLERQAAKHQFQIVRTDQYLTPNVARNMAASLVRTKYVVFIDNDALVSPDWLAPLVDCAESTGAWVVGPVYCEGEPIATRVHMAGGNAGFVVERGRRVFREGHRCYGKPLAQVRSDLRREPVEQIEFHCALVRMEVFDRLGPLDEGLLSAAEHTDLCLLARAAGGSVYLEPSSVVTYVPPPPLEPSDLPYYRLRWSEAWNTATLERFRAKWNLADDDPGLVSLAKWLPSHRRIALEPVRRVLKVFGRRPARLVEKMLVAPIERTVNRAQFPIHLYVKPAARFARDAQHTVVPLQKAA